MATPTPMKHAPSQQGRTPSGQGRTPSHLTGATPPVSTPFSNAAHAVFSPRNQRSSPQQVKKSPATTTLAGHSAMGALNFDSPSTAAAMGAFGIGGGFDMGLDGVGVGGLDTLTAAFASEDEKLRRLDTILKLLNEKKGLVSEAGIERLSQRLGMELLAEENTTPGGRKTRTLCVAGSVVALDIVLDNNIVQNVTLSYHGSAPSVAGHFDAASKILLGDLQLLPNQSPLTKTLDRFASNFERLAKLDKLSIVPGLDCHEALAGIYLSLERLHQWDIEQLRQEPDMSSRPEIFLSATAMCTKHGSPVMHARGKVGLALQYWREMRLVPPSAKLAQSSDAQDTIWSLQLGCAAIDGLGLPPIRVSEDWISKSIVKQDASTEGTLTPSLDWKEPENVSLPQSDENKDAGMEVLQPDLSTTRVPRVMFTVAFDPPIILPQNDWIRLYNYADVEPPPINPANDYGQRPPPPPPTFDALFFPLPPGSRQDPCEPRAITRTREVRVFDTEQKPFSTTHQSTLFIYKPIYAQEVTEMPFSHPHQLIEMLPLLRQYAFLSTLLSRTFTPAGTEEKQQQRQVPSSTLPNLKPTAEESTTTVTMKDQLESFVHSKEAKQSDLATQSPSQDSSESTNVVTHLDATLWVHPSPHLQVVFPMGSSTAEVMMRILEGGTVEIIDENILEPAEDDTHMKEDSDNVANRDTDKNNSRRKALTRANLARVLEYFEDLSKWAEWIRTRLA